MITPVCQSFGASSFHAILLSSNVLHFLFNAIKISGRISSSPAAFSGFQFLYGCCHFCHCEHFLFPKLNQIAYVSVGNALTGLNKSSKYSLHGEGIYLISGFQFLYGCCHFCRCEHFLFPKLIYLIFMGRDLFDFWISIFVWLLPLLSL